MYKLILILPFFTISLFSFSQTKEDIDKLVAPKYVKFFDEHQGIGFYLNEHGDIIISCIIQSDNVITQKKMKRLIQNSLPFELRDNKKLEDDYYEFIYEYTWHENDFMTLKYRIHEDTILEYATSGYRQVQLIDNYRIKLSFEIDIIFANLYDKDGNPVTRFNNDEWVRKYTEGFKGLGISMTYAYTYCREHPERLKEIENDIKSGRFAIPEVHNFNCQAEIIIATYNNCVEWFESADYFLNKSVKL